MTWGGSYEAPLTGWVTDKFGPRWIVLSGVFVFGLGLVLTSFINSLWTFYIAWGVIAALGLNIAMSVPMDTAIVNWFVKKRGLAISIRTVSSALAGVLVLPLIAWLIVTQGWRITVLIGGILMWLVGLPLAWFCIRQHRPEYYGLLPDGATVGEEVADTSQMIKRGIEYAAEVQEVEFTLRQAMRTPAYWLLILTQIDSRLVVAAFTMHTIPFLTDMGIDPLMAAGIMSIAFLASIPARLISGFLADRLKKDHLRFAIAGTYFLQAVSFAVFLLNQTITMIYVWLILYRIGMGLSGAMNTVMRSRYFGRKAYGSIQGSLILFTTPFGIAAPIYTGWVYDTTGSYITTFTIFGVLLAFSAVVMSFIIPPKPPAEVTDVRKIV